jgi:hypothetical protein
MSGFRGWSAQLCGSCRHRETIARRPLPSAAKTFVRSTGYPTGPRPHKSLPPAPSEPLPAPSEPKPRWRAALGQHESSGAVDLLFLIKLALKQPFGGERSKNARPFSESRTARVVRLNKRTPISSSSWATRRLRAEGLSRSRLAARVKLPSGSSIRSARPLVIRPIRSVALWSDERRAV